MSLEGLVLAEGFLAGWVVFASESLVAFMGSQMSSKTSGSEKTLGAIFPCTMVLSFMSVRTLDVCLQMLILEVSLVAAIVCTYKGSFVRMDFRMRL